VVIERRLMPEIDFDAAYEQLLETLRDSALGWVADQIREQVRGGKLVVRHVTPVAPSASHELAEEGYTPPSSQGGRKTRLTATEDYSAKECLSIAIAAIESAILHAAEVEDELLSFFEGSHGESVQLLFEPERPEDSPRFQLSRSERTPKIQRHRLREAIDAIRLELGSHGDS
jgi:hypothetical protein